MKNLSALTVLILAISIIGSTAIAAPIPTEVLRPYKSYRSAMEREDKTSAREFAQEAWQQAETHLGDSKTTGDLAINFATLADEKYSKTIATAFERAISLSTKYEDAAVDVRLEREILYATYLTERNKGTKAKRLLEASFEFAEQNEKGTSVFAGEIQTNLARLASKRQSFKKAEYHADKALAIFEKATGPSTIQPIFATLYSGYGKEGQENYIDAALRYQDIMQNLEGKLDNKHWLVKMSLGRWINARNRLKWDGKYEEAEAKGLCACWPYDKDRNENLKPVKRRAPKMPEDAYTSGFTIVEFDLDDEGGVINPEILESWPPKVYEKSSMRALRHWKYTPRTAEETDADRQDLVVTISYKLRGYMGVQ